MSKGAATRRTVRLPFAKGAVERRLRFSPKGKILRHLFRKCHLLCERRLKRKGNIYHESDKKTEGGRRAVEYHGRPPGLPPATGQNDWRIIDGESCGRS